jgi:sugar lactone lactonase YvrE
MARLNRKRAVGAVSAALLTVALSGCGSTGASDGPKAAGTSGSASAMAADGDWLLRFTTAEGADGEQARSVYVRYDPTTGAASSRTLPAVTASDAGLDQQVLLVSADHTRAIIDTAVPKAERRSGRLTIFSVTSALTETLDIRAVTGKPDLQAVAWAFDPTAAAVLRVVDSGGAVWKVDLDAKSATQESQLPRRSGWIFGNGFDKATGRPYIESIDSDQTEPAGNGDSDTRPVERQGGELIRYDGSDLVGLPKPPCGFAGGFRFAGGEAWLFCADTPSIATYRLDEAGKTWQAFGMPSPKIVPEVAAEMTFALPPVR